MFCCIFDPIHTAVVRDSL